MVKTGYFAMPTGDDKSLVNIYETSFDTEDIRDIISLIQNDESLLVHKSNLSAKDFATSKDIIVKQEIVDYQEITDRNNSKSQKYVYDVDVLESKAASLVKSLFKLIYGDFYQVEDIALTYANLKNILHKAKETGFIVSIENTEKLTGMKHSLYVIYEKLTGIIDVKPVKQNIHYQQIHKEIELLEAEKANHTKRR